MIILSLPLQQPGQGFAPGQAACAPDESAVDGYPGFSGGILDGPAAQGGPASGAPAVSIRPIEDDLGDQGRLVGVPLATVDE